jgi:hypothetical protein
MDYQDLAALRRPSLVGMFIAIRNLSAIGQNSVQ